MRVTHHLARTGWALRLGTTASAGNSYNCNRTGTPLQDGAHGGLPQCPFTSCVGSGLRCFSDMGQRSHADGAAQGRWRLQAQCCKIIDGKGNQRDRVPRRDALSPQETHLQHGQVQTRGFAHPRGNPRDSVVLEPDWYKCWTGQRGLRRPLASCANEGRACVDLLQCAHHQAAYA